MNLLSTLIILEDNDNFHFARLLLLIRAFSGKKGNKYINGITKLVKLDFLLRYPTYLEYALKQRGESSVIEIRDYERNSVESKMIRFKYGPWDPRYRRFINSLVAKGLVHVRIDGRTINVGLTEKGSSIAANLAKSVVYKDIVKRAALLKKRLDITGTNLMQKIYKWFPEIGNLRIGEIIEL